MTAAQSTCVFCSTPVPPIEVAASDGWHPSFWLRDREIGEPTCGACSGIYLTQGEDGEMEANALGRRRLIDQWSLARVHRRRAGLSRLNRGASCGP